MGALQSAFDSLLYIGDPWLCERANLILGSVHCNNKGKNINKETEGRGSRRNGGASAPAIRYRCRAGEDIQTMMEDRSVQVRLKGSAVQSSPGSVVDAR